MKKIITITAIAVAVASFATADVAVNINARVRSNVYSTSKVQAGTKTEKYLNLKNAAAQDIIKIAASTDYAGAVLESTWDAGNTAAGSALSIDNYYGWINFGNLKATAGVYDSRFTNRFNTTITEGGLLDSDIAKWGLSNKLSAGLNPGETKTVYYLDEKTGKIETKNVTVAPSLTTSGKTWLYDFGNVSDLSGGNRLSFLLDYTFADVGGGKLLVKGGVVESAYDTYKNSDGDSFSQLSGYVAEAAWQSDKLALDFIFKNPENKAIGAALYGTAKINKENTAAAGFTYGTQDGSIDSAFAIDGRYKFASGPFAATLIAKYSSLTVEDADDAETSLELGTEVSYVINNRITAALDGRLDLYDLDDNDEADLGENTFIVSPRVKFTAGAGATITVAVEYTQALNASDDYGAALKSKLDVPVILRVKL